MSNINQDLQATHKILQFIEASKQQGERILDQIPGVFAVVNRSGEILRANALLASYFGKDVEDLLYLPLGGIFRKEEWDIFETYLARIADGEALSLDFELNITTIDLQSKTHLWYLSKFKNNREEMFTIVGKDISDLKAAQQNLVEIFSSVPLGIITIDGNGHIIGQTSAYTEVLLGVRDLVGKGIDEVLVSRSANLTQVQKDALASMLASVGNRELIFSVIKDELPNRLEVRIENVAQWYGVTYQPIVYEGIVHKIMLILQDVTALVRAEQLQKNKELLEEAHVSRILQIKKMDPETQPIIFEEVLSLFDKISDAIASVDGLSLCRYLHGIKGCARVSGLRTLTELTHSAESAILAKLDGDEELSQAGLQEILSGVQNEWEEVHRLYQALSGGSAKPSETSSEEGVSASVSTELRNLFVEYNKLIDGGSATNLKSRYLAREILLTLESFNQHPLSSLESVLLQSVEQTAQSLDKNVRMVFDWDNAYLDKKSISILRESLTHILNNALDHGIEAADERLDLGKEEQGIIRISAMDENGELRVRCSDDGRGFMLERIRDVAVRRGLASAEDAASFTGEQLVELMFQPEFSGADRVTEISGRGIGLSAVRSSLAEVGGSVRAIIRPGGGEFEIVLHSERSRPSPKRDVLFSEVLRVFEEELSRLKDAGYALSVDYDEKLKSEADRMALYSEPDALIFALIQLVTVLSREKVNKLLLSLRMNGMLELRMEGGLSQLKPSEKYILDACTLYLQQHKGAVRIHEGVVVARFGTLRLS